MRRVEEFSGVVVLAYAFMSNHFHIFVYVPKAEEIDEAEVMRRIRALYRDASLAQVVATWNRLKTEERASMGYHGRQREGERVEGRARRPPQRASTVARNKAAHWKANQHRTSPNSQHSARSELQIGERRLVALPFQCCF